jgi:hypothetical protein
MNIEYQLHTIDDEQVVQEIHKSANYTKRHIMVGEVLDEVVRKHGNKRPTALLARWAQEITDSRHLNMEWRYWKDEYNKWLHVRWPGTEDWDERFFNFIVRGDSSTVAEALKYTPTSSYRESLDKLLAAEKYVPQIVERWNIAVGMLLSARKEATDKFGETGSPAGLFDIRR